jgi:hypothetical protein
VLQCSKPEIGLVYEFLLGLVYEFLRGFTNFLLVQAPKSVLNGRDWSAGSEALPQSISNLEFSKYRIGEKSKCQIQQSTRVLPESGPGGSHRSQQPHALPSSVSALAWGQLSVKTPANPVKLSPVKLNPVKEWDTWAGTECRPLTIRSST